MLADSGASATNDLISFAHPKSFSEPEKQLAASFNSSTVGLCLFDADLRYIAINKTLAEINGIAAQEHLGKTIPEVLGSFGEPIVPLLQRVLSTREAVHSEISGKLPSRSSIGHWIAHYFPLKNEKGVVAQIGAVVIEVTAQKTPDESLPPVAGKTRHETSRLQMLSDVSSLLASNWDVPQIFPQISARIRRVLRQEFASFALHDTASGLLVHQAIDFPLTKGILSSAQISASNSPAGRSVQQGTPLIFSKEELQGFKSEIAKSLLAEGMQSLCCVPLMRPRGPLGAFVLGSTRKNAFQADDLALMSQVAAQLAIAIENHRAVAEIEGLKQRLGEERGYLEGKVSPAGHFDEIVGDSTAVKHVLDLVATVAASDATVLILGETGTGKELVARAIHRLSRRWDGPFIKLNCAAIPTGLLESELFGHERGAFTGAINRKVGRLELADGGTIFLDEIGEIPLEVQPKLLRVLQDQEFERLGSTHTIKVNLRVLAATNRNLLESVANREFRSDLFYRLNVFPILVPALRERREDIPLLVRHFVRLFAQRMGRSIETIPKETMKALTEWHWPGNIRELENLMERSVILTEGNALRVPLAEMRASAANPAEPKDHTLDDAERAHILNVLKASGGLISGPNGAARRLGLKRTTLQSKMERLKIKRREYSGSEPE
jgi:formate hydrogenlyase transcriptional activator